MSNNLSWRDALKQFNDKRVQEGGKYTIPKKGTPEYASVRELMGEKSEAVPLKPNQTVTGASARSKSRSPKKPTDSEEKIHKAVQTLVPTKDKPLWVDEPKPVEKTAKKQKPNILQEFEPDKDGKSVLVRETHKPPTNTPEVIDAAAKAAGLKKSKSKKKSVSTQTEAPSSPKSEDFIVKLK